MNCTNYSSLDELIAENNLLKEKLRKKEHEIIDLKTCMQNYRSESKFELSENDNDYWNSKMKEYGVNSIVDAIELMNIEAIENNDNLSIEDSVYYEESNPKNINFLNGENYNLYMLNDLEYPDYL